MKWYLGLSVRPSFRLSSLFLHQRSQTLPWENNENNHEAVYRKITLYPSTVPTSPTSQTLRTCAPLTLPFHSHCCLQFEFVPEEREERSRTVACFYQCHLDCPSKPSLGFGHASGDQRLTSCCSGLSRFSGIYSIFRVFSPAKCDLHRY